VIDDLDGDGIEDLAIGTTSGSTATENSISIYIHYGRVGDDGSIVFDSSVTVPLALEAVQEASLGELPEAVLQSADLDGDGRPDLLLSAGEGSSALFWNDGERRFQGRELPSRAAWITALGELVELRGDQLVQVPYYGRHRGEGARIAEKTPLGASLYGVGDCNGDGREDLAVAAGDFFALWLAIDRSFVRFERDSSVYTVGQGVHCTDINEDEIPDIICVYDNGIKTWVSEDQP
ncbi:MAG TPA: VCBS repeat-containing protein, partial [Nannocystis exedens]|nr:VCBS repeat-containing protein [Nannocystis exedens]